MRLPRSWPRSQALVAAVAFGTALAACASADEPPVSREHASILFGDDRVADALREHPERTPRTFSELEVLLGIGRSCARSDSKEIYIVEEPSTRLGGPQRSLERRVPRAVVTGCQTDASRNGDEELFVALVSAPEAKGYVAGDSLVLDQLELMARDRTTGLYNFYVLSPEGAPGAIRRVSQSSTGDVVEHTRAVSGELTSRQQGPLCFSCHAGGEPVVNELTDPWTNWLSPRRSEPFTSLLAGETRALVSEASDSTGASSRGSLANHLEVTMRNAIRSFARGNGNGGASGFVYRVLAGEVPGGVGRLLRSTFCETSVNYASDLGLDMPLEAVVDPASYDGDVALRPKRLAAAPVRLLPVRSHFDKVVEEAMVERGFLTRDLALAARLMDDTNDVFSRARCDVLASVEAALGRDATASRSPERVVSHVRAALASVAQTRAASLRDDAHEAALARFLEVLTRASVPAEARAEARGAYLAALASTRDARIAGLATAEGSAVLAARIRERQDAARALYVGAENPLPVLP